MLSQNTLRKISEIYNGDTEDFYEYKSGPKLVSFFNENFGFSDSYGQGFPSRWYYTLDKLIHLINSGRFNNYLSIILSKKYLMIEKSISEVEAIELSTRILNSFNHLLKAEGFIIVRKGDRFELVNEDEDMEYLGEGGFAVVYRRKSNGLVVKKLKEEFLDKGNVKSRFKREYEITKSLNDLQGVIEIYDFNSEEYSYTMQFAEITLYKFVKDFDHTDEYKKVMIRQILHVMKDVHSRNCIHRDICPHNILVVNGMLKISDFGLGKDLDIFHSHRTVFTNAHGQLFYCAPEQFMQLKDGDKRSDVYSLGRIINFILAGDPRKYNHYLRSVSEKATNQNPSYRYIDAEELLANIEKCIAYHENAEKREEIREKARMGIIDDDVANFICELNGEEICRELNANHPFLAVLIEYLKSNEKISIEILELINTSFVKYCGKNYDSYDPIAQLAYRILHDDAFCFIAKELSANILKHIAYRVNRFSAQNLIEQLIREGIEPFLEEILQA